MFYIRGNLITLKSFNQFSKTKTLDSEYMLTLIYVRLKLSNFSKFVKLCTIQYIINCV